MMKIERASADASLYYRERTALEVVRMDSTAAYGNLAAAMKNNTIWFATTPIAPSYGEVNQPNSENDAKSLG